MIPMMMMRLLKQPKIGQWKKYFSTQKLQQPINNLAKI